MKILNLRFKNLNSLYGEWSIDFTAPEYVEDGIFAITGPTGAGKSTILDAICLALYGRTPRLSSISKTSNEVMSRQTGECFSEVKFQVNSRQFTCFWGQHRARKKPDGRLAESRHEISDAAGDILASKKRDVASIVEEKTGMDFDRFTRSMLLAQGNFDAFLRASPDDRSPILEQITGKGIYTEISKLVHERLRAEKEKLDRMNDEILKIGVFSDEEEAKKKQELAEKEREEKKTGKKNDELQKAINWLTGIDRLKKDLVAIDSEAKKLAIKQEAFKPKREHLQRAMLAAESDSDYARLSAQRDRQKTDLDTLTKSRHGLAGVKKDLDSRESSFKRAEHAVIQAKNAQKTGAILVTRVRAFDLKTGQKQAEITTARKDLQRTKDEISKKKKQVQAAGVRLKNESQSLRDINNYLVDNAGDAALVTQFTGITEQVRNLDTALGEVSQVKKRIAGLKKDAETGEKQVNLKESVLSKHNEQHDQAQKDVSQAKSQLDTLLNGRLLREYRNEHAGLLREMAYLNHIADLEEERTRLEDGRPCPLCGSLQHPFAKGNVPRVDETERKINKLADLIKQADTIETRIKRDEAKETRTKEALSDAEKGLMIAKNQQNNAQKALKQAENDLQAAKDRYDKTRAEVAKKLLPFGMVTLPETGLKHVITQLEARLKTWKESQKKADMIKQEISSIEAEQKSLDAVINVLMADLQKKHGIADAHKRDLDKLVAERSVLYGDKDPDIEEKRMQTLVDKAEAAEKQAREDRDRARRDLNELNARITTLEEKTNQGIPVLRDLESEFLGRCKKAGFADEAGFLDARMEPEQRRVLTREAQSIDRDLTDIKARKRALDASLDREKAKAVTSLPLDEIKQEHTKTMDAGQALSREIGSIRQKLLDNAAAKARIQDKKVLVNAQKKECTRWDKLHLLIGSADGKKYRNFAQGITFELMVSHANRQLKALTDRYLLVRDKRSPLELNVIDNFQAGEIRSTKNLSGGESFIVSLALALGMSKMASRKVRVDSLFLDEGFGSLDEDTLETALETLSSLHQDGKLIGIISHVSALRDRIGTQIDVQPQPGGKSRISGPGCKGIQPSAPE